MLIRGPNGTWKMEQAASIILLIFLSYYNCLIVGKCISRINLRCRQGIANIVHIAIKSMFSLQGESSNTNFRISWMRSASVSDNAK